jgi:hypothetical protein
MPELRHVLFEVHRLHRVLINVDGMRQVPLANMG